LRIFEELKFWIEERFHRLTKIGFNFSLIYPSL
jgi:hypothetical protein